MASFPPSSDAYPNSKNTGAASKSSGHSRNISAEALLEGTEKKKKSRADSMQSASSAAATTVRDTEALTVRQSTTMAVFQSPSQAATYIASARGAAPSNTQVIVSQNLNTHSASETKWNPRIKRDGDFKDLVTQSTIFADKSLFIKDVIEDSDTVLLLAMPRRWGKTVNLDMLRRFLEVPVDSNGKVIDGIATANYQIFRKECVLQPDGGKSLLKISHSKILVQNSEEDVFCQQEVDALKLQGTYPVIYIDFKNCKSNSFNTVREGVKSVLSDCFEQHRYLEKSDHLDEEEKEKIKRYVGDISSESLDDDQIKSGLRYLSEMLYRHFDNKKKIWILIDEYDAAANVAYRKFKSDDLDDTIELFAGIYENALKSNPYLEKGVLTGVQYIAQSGMLSGLNNLGKFNATDAKYAQYYGLDQGEVDLFFNHFGVPKPLGDKAKSWYNGYQVQKYNGNLATSPQEFISKYNTWSIVSYLKRGEFHCFKSHWEESGNIDFLDELLTKTEVRGEVEKLIDGACISFTRKDDFSANDFKQLKNMIGGNTEISPDGLVVLFSYLFTGGYLTIDGYNHNSYRFPNMEITYEMGKRLIKYYQHICTIDPAKIQSVINALQDIMCNPPRLEHMQEHFKNFYNQFKEVIRAVRLVGDKNAEVVFANEDLVHSILNYIALQMQHTTFGSELYIAKLHSKRRGRADIKMTHHAVGVIMEITCVPSDRSNDHMEEALKQAMSYGNLLGTRKNLFIAVNIDRKSMSTSEEKAIEFLCALAMSDGLHVFGINASGNADTFCVDDSLMKGFTEHR